MADASFEAADRRERRSARCRRLVPAAAVAASIIAVAAAMLCACTDQEKVHEGELTQLLALLPGTYDNAAQAELDARTAVRNPHDPVALTITHVQASRLGHYVYYAQETAADDPRRVLSQKMYGFRVDEKRGIVETVYELNEPLRWRDGQLNKDLFSSMLTSDVQTEGCQLFWKKKDSGFVATHDPKVCPDAGGGAAREIEFNGGNLTIGDYKFRKSH
jgi:CpeT/CpcT family (DUF1001)